MALLQKIKEKLGFGGGDASESDGGETTVTVEHESDGSAGGRDTEASASGTETAGSAETAGGDATGGAVESGENAVAGEESEGDETDVASEGTDRAPRATDATSDEESATSGEAAATDDGTSVDQIKGIGPAYAERLDEVDIHTVADLAAADPAAVAEGTSVGEKRAATWVDRAKEF